MPKGTSWVEVTSNSEKIKPIAFSCYQVTVTPSNKALEAALFISAIAHTQYSQVVNAYQHSVTIPT